MCGHKSHMHTLLLVGFFEHTQFYDRYCSDMVFFLTFTMNAGYGYTNLLKFSRNLNMLGATIQNLVATVTWHPGFVHPCYRGSHPISWLHHTSCVLCTPFTLFSLFQSTWFISKNTCILYIIQFLFNDNMINRFTIKNASENSYDRQKCK